MQESNKVFHLAIPCKDLDEAARFYNTQLGCKLARRYDDRITVDFFGDQIVCHLSPEKVDEIAELYPRHFGVTFLDRSEFDDLLRLIRTRQIPFFKEPIVRFQNTAEEHSSFCLLDPSNNVLEFKHYVDPRMSY